MKAVWGLKTMMYVKFLDWACDLQYVSARLSLRENTQSLLIKKENAEMHFKVKEHFRYAHHKDLLNNNKTCRGPDRQ